MNKNFLLLVKEMRASQREYFRLSSVAKRSRTPEAFAEAKTMLAKCKVLEGKVDKSILAYETSPTTLA